MGNTLSDRFKKVRLQTLKLAEPLHPEDSVVQPTVDVSPPKWHLAHTTWFFETFILRKFVAGFKPFNKEFDYLFNSYYEGQGNRVKRDMRGFHPRPLLSEVLRYREFVDNQMLELISLESNTDELLELVELGLQHEQQHQELLITDLKYIWGFSPFHPVYVDPPEPLQSNPAKLEWLSVEEGMYKTGYSGIDFHFDNESPEHKIWLEAFEIASRTVTVGEYLEFIESGGYSQWQHWLHEGWQWINKNEIYAPEYWKLVGEEWNMYTLNGLKKLNKDETLTHISFYEADAFARWKGLRLPTEQEWEVAAGIFGRKGSHPNFLETGLFHPGPVDQGDKAFLGQVWEWTNSAYLPYPGFKPWEGSIAEYNGKFMISQMVLRGGSCATPSDHIRLSYRNFFHPWLRWQFTGIRLTKNKA
jgi:ergothioneine biosynthesis protein EgtB